MIQSDIRWQTRNHTEIFGQVWKPEGTPKAVLTLVHGLGEHIARYQHVAEMFCDHGYALIGSDHIGHGKSGGKRGHVDSYEDFMQEIDHLLSTGQEQFAAIPQVMYGHSLGGNLVLYYALKRRPQIAGVIVTSPAIATANTGKALAAAANVLSVLLPRVTVKNGLVLEGLSHDTAVVEAYQKDPLNHDRVSFRLGAQLISSGAWILKHAADFPLPLLLMQGTDDKLVDPAATREFAHHLQGNFVYQEWQGGYHELHNEPYKQQVFEVMVDWLDNLLQDSPG